jgi:hypothetical protein
VLISAFLVSGWFSKQNDTSGFYSSGYSNELALGTEEFTADKWTIDLAETNEFSLKYQRVRVNSKHQTYTPIPVSTDIIAGTWTKKDNEVILRWEIESIVPIKVINAEDMSLWRNWKSKDGKIIYAKVQDYWLKDRNNLIQDPFSPNQFIKVIDKQKRWLTLYKHQLHDDEWEKWSKYVSLRLNNKPRVTYRDEKRVEQKMLIFTIESNGDLIRVIESGEILRLSPTKR